MATIDIDIRDYLSEDSIADMVEEQVCRAIREKIEQIGISDLLTEISYEVARRIVCEEFKISQQEFDAIITERTKQIIDDPAQICYELFRRKSDWLPYDGPAIKCLQEAIAKNKPQLEAAVLKAIENYPFKELRDAINDTIYFCIMRKLNSKESGE